VADVTERKPHVGKPPDGKLLSSKASMHPQFKGSQKVSRSYKRGRERKYVEREGILREEAEGDKWRGRGSSMGGYTLFPDDGEN